MKIIDDLISSLGEDSQVRGVYACVLWTAVVSRNCGLASTFPMDTATPKNSQETLGHRAKTSRG